MEYLLTGQKPDAPKNLCLFYLPCNLNANKLNRSKKTTRNAAVTLSLALAIGATFVLGALVVFS